MFEKQKQVLLNCTLQDEAVYLNPSKGNSLALVLALESPQKFKYERL